MIISGDKVGFLDPQERIWSGKSGNSKKLSVMQRDFPNHLAPFDGIAGFSSSQRFSDSGYPKTLFRFPLRTRESNLSKNLYDPRKVLELINALREEAKLLLLFLRSVETIEVYEIGRSGRHTLKLKIGISGESVAAPLSLRAERASFCDRIHDSHSNLQSHKTFESIVIATVKVTDHMGSSSGSSRWLISSLVESEDYNVVKMAKEINVLPWVGTALELERPRSHESGRIFCFLPMPCETCTDLPVHVNGTFSLNDDRRTLKWPGRERRNDPSADWNKILVEKVFPSCYVLLLKAALNCLTAEEFYAALPDVIEISSTNWGGLLHPLYSSLFEHACLWSIRKKWVRVCNATFIPEHESITESVKEVITSCGFDLVDIPSNMWHALRLVHPQGVQTLTPDLTRRAIKANKESYVRVSASKKLDLLEYCLSDENYSKLADLQLLPLANGSFKSFKSAYFANQSNSCYVCTDECPQKLLPNAEHRLVNLSDRPSLHSKLKKVASSGKTQLTILDACGVAELLPLIFPQEWEKNMKNSLNGSNFPKTWFEIFWNWVKHNDLSLFEDLFIVPIASETNLSVMRLKSNSGVVCVQRFNTIPAVYQNIFSKLGINYTLCEHVPYLKHRDLMSYLNPLTPDGVLTALKEAHSYISEIRSVPFFKAEAAAFQTFLAHHHTDLSRHQEAVEYLSIFLPLGEQVPVSLVVSSFQGKRVILEPRGFFISHYSLPSNLIILSQSSNHYTLLQISNIVCLPDSNERFILDFVFPLIKSGTFKPLSKLSPLMQEIFNVFSTLRSPDFIQELRVLPFIPFSSECSSRKSPQDLYDPSKSVLRQLYSGKEVFPLPPFDREEYLLHLRTCGLKTSINGQDLYDILTEISQDYSPAQINANTMIRGKTVFMCLNSYEGLLSNYISVYWRSKTLKQAIVELASKKSILPIESSPSSEDYPTCLPWKGAKCTSHLTSMNSSVLPCSSKAIDISPDIVGSQMYVVFCPSELCSALCPEPPVEHVVSHFMEIIKHKDELARVQLDDLANKTYNCFEANLQILLERSSFILYRSNWVWLKNLCVFVSPQSVAFERHPNFTHSLSPFLHVLPEDYFKFSTLFIKFGAHGKITDQLLVSVLNKVKDGNHSVSCDQVWKMVSNILNCVTDHGRKDITYFKHLCVPVESASSYPELVTVGDVVYTDLKYLKNFQKSKNKSLKFVHKDYMHLALCLGLTPLSKELKISDDAFEDVGQSEPLVKRLKNILRDYKDGLTIIKELLQNADDAGASEVNICYDARQHSQNTDNLIFEGMAKCHGPALIVQNNQTFSDDDFSNIQKLAGATKQDQPLKIGKFGVGFCSVYHITDVPSFISRDLLYIFDPTLEYLEGAVTNPMKPGKKLRFTDEYVQYSSQMDPYKGLFKFKPNVPYDGTLFRLPFRTHSSDISRMKYGKTQVDKLISDVKEAGPKLLLFMKHLKSITFSHMDDDLKGPIRLLTVSKSIVDQTLLRDIHMYHMNDTTSAEIVTLNVSEIKSSTVEQVYLVAESRDIENSRVSAVACSLEKLSFTYRPKEVRGEVFCFLPLHLETGLPVHVSANFAVMNDRRGIHYSDSIYKSDESQFNVRLMEESIPLSYHKLLTTLRDLCQEGKISVDDYKFHTFWPLEESLKTHNPWDYFLPYLYEFICSGDLCYSKCIKEWRSISSSRILSTDILQSEQATDIKNVMKTLNYPLISLPERYHCHLHGKVEQSTVNENEFIDIFFWNIETFPASVDMRNNVLLSLITTYAIRPSFQLEAVIKRNPCIPCTPRGQVLKKCNEIIDSQVSDFKTLYEPEDGMFAVESFNKDIVRVTLLRLGAISSQLPWHMVIERANTVKELYASNREKALMRTKLLISCIDTNLKYSGSLESLPPEANELTKIAFLPVLQRPKSYPRELKWAGNNKILLSSSQLLIDRLNINLIGSAVSIISNELPSSGGCGYILSSVISALRLADTPSIDDILKHLEHIVHVYNSTGVPNSSDFFTSWISKACDAIYKHFEERISKGNANRSLKRLLSRPGLLWNGREFIRPEQIALNWKHDGPHLYALPSLLKHGKEKLKQFLNLKEDFSTDVILQVLNKMRNVKELNHREEKSIADIALALAESIGEDGMLNAEQMELCFLPDENLCMRNVKHLAWKDVLWCNLEEEHYFIHYKINHCVALKLGVKPIRSKALDMYSSPCDDFAGVPFGQREELTQRIRNILDTYTHDETVLKELLQNADDAKSTKLYFILDKRTHGTKRVFTDEWKDLQGPALLVWNDKGFTEDDMGGIQKLGLGSKRSKAESIGQYGIGFNVVYHLTDCPSFFTNGKTLCVLDPHCRYMPGATERKPGRRLDNVDEKFWSNLSDLKTAYLREGLDCPNEIRESGTLFRFPLRSTAELVKKSELVEEENKSLPPLSACRMEARLKEWAPKMKEALIFIKHVTDLKFFVITDGKVGPTTMVNTHHYMCELSDEVKNMRLKLHEGAATFTERSDKLPLLVDYKLKLVEKVPNKEEEQWLVQQGVGDINNPSQHWEYLSYIKPMHGLAAQIKGSSFTPKIFCFLPLPNESKLPVHVNGNFILDSSSRSTLWQSRDTSTPDDKKKWNNRLIEALGASYAKFLIRIQDSIIKRSTYTKPRDISNDIERYYSFFPKWIDSYHHYPENEMKDLARITYENLGAGRCRVLVVVNKNEIVAKKQSPQKKPEYMMEWHPVLNDDAAKQVHFWKTSEEKQSLPPILKRIGIVLSAAPMWIKEHFDSVEVNIPQALPGVVYQYYTQHFHQISRTQSFPIHISDTSFRNVDSMKNFIKYVVEKYVSENGEETYSSFLFPSSPFGYPLLLTADEQVRLFSEKDKVISSEHSQIFKKVLGKFLHSTIFELKLDRNYFVQPSQENWELVRRILSMTLQKSLHANRVVNASAHINIEGLLKILWKCLREDNVFQKHTKVIVQEWALILSNDNELFRYDPDLNYLMPITPPRKPATFEWGQTIMTSEEDALKSDVFEVLRKHGMPVVHWMVLTAKEFCPNFPNPQNVLTNLRHLHDDRGLDSLLADRDVDVHVEKLFSYFSEIHFAHDQISLHNIKHLPLFKNIDGRYCSLADNGTYFWPDLICMDGTKMLISQTPAIFLPENGPWSILTNAATLGIQSVDPLTFYVDFIFPYFHLLSDEDRISHLNHIMMVLFPKAEEYAKMETDKGSQALGNRFIYKLKNLAILKDKGAELQPAHMFSDPSAPVFKTFPDKYSFPPISKDIPFSKWISFLIKIGLQTKPSKEDYTKYCVQVSQGNHAEIKKASSVLLELLFKIHDWHSDDNFLQVLSQIPFITPKTSANLDWIVPPSTNGVNIIHQRKKKVGLVSSRNSASDKYASLIWTVLPLVKFPQVSHPPDINKISDRKIREQILFRNLGICVKPSISQVIENLCNLSTSRFSNIKLFENYNQDCIKPKPKKETEKYTQYYTDLFIVIKGNVEFLHEEFSRTSKMMVLSSDDNSNLLVSKLKSVPFIPVSKDYSYSGDLSRPILVHPLQVVVSIPSELAISLYPCLIILPKELESWFSTLAKVGVNHGITMGNIFYAFELIHSHFKMPLDPNTVKSVKTLLKLLYQCLNTAITDDAFEGDHYLPGCNHSLFESTNLLYDEWGCYKMERFDFSSVPKYSMMSLLCHKNDEIDEYGFRMIELIDKIPESFRPRSLSSCCTDKLDSSCVPESQLSEFAKSLENTFQISDFAKAAQRLLKKHDNEGACIQFSASLKEFVESVKIYSVPELKVNIYLNLTNPPRIIGSAHMDFKICRDESDQLILYIDSNASVFRFKLLELLTKAILTEVLKMSNVAASELKEPETILTTLLKIQSPDDLKTILNECGIKVSDMKFERKFDYHLNPKLGEPIPDEFHHRLHADIYNNFKPQELVGYEKRENRFIFARVEYKVRKDTVDEDEDEELDRYVIRLKEGEEDDCEKMVSVVYLHKILRIKEDARSSNIKELELFDPDSEIVRWWDTIKDEKLKDILQRIFQELKWISRIRDEDEKRKAQKAMYLKWHPDKNKHPFATKAFQYLQIQIRRMKEGLEIQDPSENWANTKPSSSERYYDDWTHVWEEIIRQRRRGHDNEQSWRSGHGAQGDSGNSTITVSPDPYKAKVWMKTAKYDVRSMKANYELAKFDDTLCALVCFLSHQVAEKTLKAGMYAKNGLHPDALQHHKLIGHARALEQVDTAMIGLSELARTLEGKDYYLKSRYPNQYSPHQVPSECLHLSEAEKAVEISTEIHDLVYASCDFTL